MGSLLLPCAPRGLSLSTLGCLSGATPRGQPWTTAVTLWAPPSTRRMAVLSTFRAPARCRQGHCELLRSAWLDVTPIIPAVTACHQRNYVERYSRFRGSLALAERDVLCTAASGRAPGVGLRPGLLPFTPTPSAARSPFGQRKHASNPREQHALGARWSGSRLTTQRGGLSLPLWLCYPARVEPTPCGCRALGSPSPRLSAYRLLSPARPSGTPP
jgi:hypothetical protein